MARMAQRTAVDGEDGTEANRKRMVRMAQQRAANIENGTAVSTG